MPPDAEVIEQVAPENSVEVIEDTATREDAREEKPYTLEDAVSEAEAKLSGKEQKEEPAKKEEAKAESKTPQEKPAVADTDDEVRRALDHYKAMSDPSYQKMLYENLHKVHGVVEKSSSAPQKSPEEIELDEVLNSLDPGVRKAFEALASQGCSSSSGKTFLF